MEFIALDFETASGTPGSICAVGLVRMEQGRVTDEYYSLVNPGCSFEWMCTRIHGITEEMVTFAPDVDEMLNTIAPYLKGQLVVAHNASFDISQLRAATERYEVQFPPVDFLCTLTIARRAFPGRRTYRLGSLIDIIGFEYAQHNALEDARACAFLMQKCIEKCGDPVDEILNINRGYLKDGEYSSCRVGRKKTVRIKEENESVSRLFKASV